MQKSTRQLEALLRRHRGPALLVDGRSRRIIAANQATARTYGYAKAQLPGLPIEALWPGAPSELDGKPPAGVRISRHRAHDGHPMDVKVSVLGSSRGHCLVGLSLESINDRAFSLALLETRSKVLERISRGAPLAAVLGALVETIEALSGDMLGSVLLLAPDGARVTHGAAPHLPPAYWKAINGMKIGPTAGSCGTAMFTGKQVIVADVAIDTLWRDYRKLALRHGLRACWSTPILSPRGAVLGAFALYYRDPRRPGEHEKQLVQVAAELAAIAIECAHHTPREAPLDKKELSARELQVLRLIAHGEPVKRIASGLRVSISTVYTHRARILDKLAIRSNAELVRYAMKKRLVQ